MADKKTFFDYLTNIINTKDIELMEADIGQVGFNNTFSNYMIIRYLSMSPKYEKIIFEEQLILNTLGNESLYRYLFKRLPKGQKFIKYIK